MFWFLRGEGDDVGLLCVVLGRCYFDVVMVGDFDYGVDVFGELFFDCGDVGVVDVLYVDCELIGGEGVWLVDGVSVCGCCWCGEFIYE